MNGRLRERNIIRHIPTQRIVENYLYGQIHFDILDREGKDPFTSSREGIVEDDLQFQSLMDYLKRDLIPKVIDEWDKLRLDRGQEGDDENTRKTKKARKARDLYSAAKDEFKLDDGSPEKDQVDEWLTALQADAQFNLEAYVDCFLCENLVRKFIHKKSVTLSPGVQKDVTKWKTQEIKRKGEANISFSIRRDNDDLSYLDMDALAVTAEGSQTTSGQQSLRSDAIAFKPIRNAVGHTGLLTTTAKNGLNLTFINMKSRVKTLLAKGTN